MALKNEILEILERNRMRPISGSEIAAELGVTRAAVWKAVEALRKDGHVLDGASNRGYMLAPESDVLSAEGIRSRLNYDADVRVFEKVVSTNVTAKQIALDGAPDGTIVAADGQTGGKGRRGRSFFSPPGSGLYMSIILRPKVRAEDSVYLTTAAAVATAEAIEELTGRRAQIKWLNDIYLDGKKCVGILCEATFDYESGELESVVVGVGVNVSNAVFPAELENRAGSIGRVSRNALAAGIANRLKVLSGRLPEVTHMSAYRERCFVPGNDVTVTTREGSYEAFATGLDDRARLIVRTADGTEHTLSNEEVSVKVKEREQ